ncbi:MAG: hypothetical protein ACD_44C00090G0002, partial [uncultured bacterium]
MGSGSHCFLSEPKQSSRAPFWRKENAERLAIIVTPL